MSRVLVIQKLISFGKEGLSVSLPVLTVLGNEVITLSEIFSNCDDVCCVSSFKKLFSYVKENKIVFDGVFISGSLSCLQLKEINNFLSEIFVTDKGCPVIFSSNDNSTFNNDDFLDLSKNINVLITDEKCYTNCSVLKNNITLTDKLVVSDFNVSAQKKKCFILDKNDSEYLNNGTLCGKWLYYNNYPEEFNGADDIISSVIAGGFIKSCCIEKSVKLALKFLDRCVDKTLLNPEYSWYGLDFELILPQLPALAESIL